MLICLQSAPVFLYAIAIALMSLNASKAGRNVWNLSVKNFVSPATDQQSRLVGDNDALEPSEQPKENPSNVDKLKHSVPVLLTFNVVF
jgi:hypothetical protein